MASFVIHKIAADKLLKLLEEEYGLLFSEDDKKQFQMGNLIVDSTRTKLVKKEGETDQEARRRYSKAVQQEKILTHFRSEEDQDLCIQVPQLESFTSKYQDLLNEKNIPAIAYLFHLFTDKNFFEDLFTKTFETLDEELNPTIYTSKTKHMLVKKNNQLYAVADFWDSHNPKSIYHDYTVMNKILLEHYDTSFDKASLLSSAPLFINPGIEEVDFENISTVINKTASFIDSSYKEENSTLHIFDQEQVKDFIESNARSFLSQYGTYFGLVQENNKQYQKTANTTERIK